MIDVVRDLTLAAETSPWDLTNVPEGLNNVLFGGLNLLGAQIILVIMIAMCFVLPALIAKADADVIVILIIFTIFVSTALGWLDVIIGSMMCIFIALFYAKAIRKMVVG